MSEQEKAKQLIERFLNNVSTHHYNFQYYQAKQCAIICVDEIIKALPDKTTFEHGIIGYWQRVQSEIEERYPSKKD